MQKIITSKTRKDTASVETGSSLLCCHIFLDVFEWLSLHSINVFIGITISMSFELTTNVLFPSRMQSVNRTQFLNIPFTFTLSGNAADPAFATIIVPLRSIYASF